MINTISVILCAIVYGFGGLVSTIISINYFFLYITMSALFIFIPIILLPANYALTLIISYAISQIIYYKLIKQEDENT